MPLDKSGSKASVGTNIKAEEAAGKPHKQAIAIALSVQRRAGDGHTTSGLDHAMRKHADEQHPVKKGY